MAHSSRGNLGKMKDPRRGIRTGSVSTVNGRRTCLSMMVVVLLLLCCTMDSNSFYGVNAMNSPPDGPKSLARGQKLFREQKFEEAAPELWKAVLFHGDTPPERTYNVQEAFQMFIQCYLQQNRLADGFAFVALESFRRGQVEMGKQYLKQALSVDPNNEAALEVQEEFGMDLDDTDDKEPASKRDHEDNKDLAGLSPEQLYEIGSRHFSNKEYEECADVFEISCQRSKRKLGPSCANAVYCRTLFIDYGFNGTQFERDMDRVVRLIKKETKEWRKGNLTDFAWKRSTSVHPHMMLGFPVDSMLKRFVAESVAYLDEKMARATESGGTSIPPLPPGLPYEMEKERTRYLEEVMGDPQFRIRVGFVGSGFNSKAVLYLSQDMFRFFDKTQFEIHIFSFGPADNPMFIRHGMRGVDWRERVKANVDYFHDCQAMKMDHIKAARFIHEQKIHILIEWDGYARQGERAQGLFALRPAPVQILHQEYLGTSGAQYVDYLFTDAITTPVEKDNLFTEKLIFLPNHFFSKGHAYQAEVKEPTYDYKPKKFPYEFGTGNPKENRCLAPKNIGPTEVSFVFCNFNKFLKANPQTIRSWIRILREVPNSMLCLVENPDTGIPYIRRFVHEAAGVSTNHSDPGSFVAGNDSEELISRIHFLPWAKNPFDHQMRNQDFCNVMLDSYPYNGHTVAQDALYGGVPIVTRSDGDDMSSRVTTSANSVLGLEELNAYEGPQQYEDIAIRIGLDEDFYDRTRRKLIDTCLQRNPMHRYWDVARYVKNFEQGLKTAWEFFLDSKDPAHIFVEETDLASRGTYDYEILMHPPDGMSTKHKPIQPDEL